VDGVFREIGFQLQIRKIFAGDELAGFYSALMDGMI
jgi:hypothetical protein